MHCTYSLVTDSCIHPKWSILGQIWPMAVSDFHYLQMNAIDLFPPVQCISPLSILISSSTVWLLGRRLWRLPEEPEWTHPSICWPFDMLDVSLLFILSFHWGLYMNSKLAESAQWHTLNFKFMCAYIKTSIKMYEGIAGVEDGLLHLVCTKGI